MNCEEVYDGTIHCACPVCASCAGWPLVKWVGTMAGVWGKDVVVREKVNGLDGKKEVAHAAID